MVTVRDAATVMLVRNHPDLEVFMLRRHPQAAFGPGAYVFPGGAVDASDHTVPVVGRDAATTDTLMTRPGALRWWAAAAREAFEEAGFLLAADVAELDLGTQRRALNAGELEFASLLGELDTHVTADAMHLFSHWLTPPGQPRRYDTWFLVGEAPDGQVGEHDNAETVDSEWVRPIEMVHRWRNDTIDLIFPTVRTLLVMSEYDTTTELLEVVRAREEEAIRNHTTPLLVDDASGERVAMTEAECAEGRRGWRALEPSWELDHARMLADYAHTTEGASTWPT